MISKPGRNHWRLAGLASILPALFFAVPGHAGVVNGVQTADGLTINLGVVPAAVVQAHPTDHPEPRMHGGTPGRSIHNMHLVVAVFDATGARVTKASVAAHIFEQGGRQWKVPLRPMIINGALTFGGYTAFPKDTDYRIGISVQRPQPKRRNPITVHFTWAHD